MTDEEIIKAFRGLYSGGWAQKLRDSGVPDHLAMPPWTETYWLGKRVIKCPNDLWMYQEVIFETRPDVLLEAGTSGGGSAFYFATLFDLLGHGQVITVDKDAYLDAWVRHPRITYLVGDSVSDGIVEQMRNAARGKKTMVSLDSLHTYDHVGTEVRAYGPLVTSGLYLVVEDVADETRGGVCQSLDKTWGTAAVVEFMAAHQEFVQDRSKEKHLMTSNLWLRKS